MSRNWVDLRAVKASVSLEAVLRHYRVQGLRRAGVDSLRGRCPLHGRGGEDAFHASLYKNAFRCFYCQAQGNVLDLVAAMEQCSLREAALRLQEWFAIGSGLVIPVNRGEATLKNQLVPKKEECNRPLRFTLSGVDGRHPYLAQRNIDPSTAACFGVGFYSGPGLMAQRLVIPIHDELGRIIAYAGRCLDGTAPRYKLPPGFRKSLVLFNLHRAVRCGQTPVVVVEGFFDCMKVHQAGFPCVVALMGATLSEAQQSLLLPRFPHIILLLDGDATGRVASQSIGSRLAGRCSLLVHQLPPNKQPDQLTNQQIQRELAEIARA